MRATVRSGQGFSGVVGLLKPAPRKLGAGEPRRLASSAAGRCSMVRSQARSLVVADRRDAPREHADEGRTVGVGALVVEQLGELAGAELAQPGAELGQRELVVPVDAGRPGCTVEVWLGLGRDLLGERVLLERPRVD